MKNEDCQAKYCQASYCKANYCQSCGMPFDEAHREFIAKEADGSDSVYCTYCYKNGQFLNPNATVEDMIEMGVPHLAHKIGGPSTSPEDEVSRIKAAREQLRYFVPTLGRWKKK